MSGKRLEVSRKGLKFVAQFEGLSLTAYRGPGETYYTIGYGHYGPSVKAGQRITKATARKLLRGDLATAAAAVRADVKVHLNQAEFDALTSFTFNDGVGALSTSTLLADLNRHDRKDVPSELMRWVHDSSGAVSPGLVRRRRAEARLFQTGRYS